MIKHPHTEVFIAVLYNAGSDIIMPRCELAIAVASNISHTIHCIHKSNVKLHELIYTYFIF